MRYFVASGSGLQHCTPCRAGLARGYARPGAVRPRTLETVHVRAGALSIPSIEVVDLRSSPEPVGYGACPLCGASRSLYWSRTVLLGETHLPIDPPGVPVEAPDDAVAFGPGTDDIDASQAAEEVRVAAEARALEGVVWSGLTWSMGPEARGTWTGAAVLASSGQSLGGSPIAAKDGVYTFKDNADFMAGFTAVGNATRALMAAQGQGTLLVRANPLLLDDVLEAVRLAPEDPAGATALLGALA